MDRNTRILLFLFLSSSICFSFALPQQRFVPASSSSLEKNLLSRVTFVGPSVKSRTIDQLATLNPRTGEEDVLVDTFVHANFSITLDGLSTVDRKRGVFYYATDSASTFIYPVDSKNKAALPPIDLHLSDVVDLEYDNVRDELLVYGFIKTESGKLLAYLVACPPSYDKEITWYQLPPPQVLGANGIAYDALSRTAYFPAFGGSSHTVITSFSLDTRSTATYNVSCPYMYQLHYDTDHPPFTNPLYGQYEQFNGTSDQDHTILFNIDLEKQSCEEIRLKFPEKGIVTATTMDQTSGDFFFVMASRSGPYLLSYNVRNGESTGVRISGRIPADIAI